MDSHKNYQESKVKGSVIGIFPAWLSIPAWLSNILSFEVSGPGGAVVAAASGELISRKIKREIWNSARI